MNPCREALHTPECLEVAFCDLRQNGVLRSSAPIRTNVSGNDRNCEKKHPPRLQIHRRFIALGNHVGELLSRKWKEEALSLDEISRGLANETLPRRRALAVLAATAVGALIPFGRAEAVCAGRGHPCEGNQDCCGRLVCRSRGPGEAKRCRRRETDDD
jgi:hypothetical protein